MQARTGMVLGWLLVAGVASTTMGCGSSAPVTAPTVERAPDPQDVVGTWTDETNAVFAIARDGSGAVKLVSGIDADGEVMTDLQSGWSHQGKFWLRYVMPSTKYQVSIVFTQVEGDRVTYTWSNIDSDGGSAAGEREQEMTR